MDFISNDTVTSLKNANYMENEQKVKNEVQYAVCFFKTFKSKHGHESNFYCSDFDELGVVGKL